jgi:beta-N-acetylhexosaminidase
MFKKYLFTSILLVVSLNNIWAQANTPTMAPSTAKWVDSVYNSLNLDQKLGQLFMVAAYSGGEKYNRANIEKLIANNYIGGLIFMQGTPEAQAEQTNAFQASSKVPLMIAMDAEWGLGMRLKSVDDMPRQIMMGAMQDSSLVYKMGQAVAKQCRRLGVHVNFAPVVDINNNPANPVINFRSFGENKYNVVKFATQYMRGMQDNGVLACAKHFPGHGNTDADSHKELPTISSNLKDLENLELYPFRELINKGIGSIMIAHLQVPALDNAPNMPTTLSRKVVTELLKTKYNYKGLIFTDALNMKGVTKYYKPGEVDMKAFIAGNDVLLFSEDVATGVSKIKEALQNKTITQARVDESVKKILLAKYLLGLNKKQKIEITNITNDLNNVTSSLRTQIAKASATLLIDQYNVIDKIAKNATNKVAYIAFGAKGKTAMGEALAKRGITEQYIIDGSNTSVLQKLKNYNAVIIGMHGIALYPGTNFGISASDIAAINTLQANNNTMLVIFGNPYATKYFLNGKGILVAYDEKTETQNIAADICTGNLRARGKLPVSVGDNYKQGVGIVAIKDELGLPNNFNPESEKEILTIKKKDDTQLAFETQIDLPVNLTCCVNPSVIGADVSKLNKIDALIENAIERHAFPGARLLIAKEGKVFYNKSFGYTAYDNRTKVNDNTLYDIASVTKVAATTLSIMKLYDEGKINLDNTLGFYLPMARNSDKSNLLIKNILLHQAGLKSWIAFYKETLDSNKMRLPEIYAHTYKEPYTVKVANDIYMNKHWQDTMWQRILTSPLGAPTYEYSDLDFIFLQKVIEKITGQSLDKYVENTFYKPLGLQNTFYNPLNKKVSLSRIAPSENDDYFRYQTIHGYVHDMGAAMFGGVSGHAGIFSTADDLSVLLQLVLNNGMYNGKRYFSKKTVDVFTSYHSNSRRGYGWDKPEPKAAKSNPAADNCSLETYGHQGFTGTCIWADPTYNLQFVFLSNRTYPSADNKLLTSLGIRTKAQELAYEALGIASKR